jgi:glycosyltransferase involved in cell wall biosynthesis
MKISGFTYVRNGITYQYPFIASIKSLLPIVDEMIVVVGDSNDGTRESIAAIDSSKIKIIDTIWDPTLNEGGKIYALQANTGLEASNGDWLIHIQADEVIHEKVIQKLKEAIIINDPFEEVDGLLLPFYHFWGDYKYIRTTRKTHRFEIRAFRNKGVVKSFRDSQGFRKYKSESSYKNGDKGWKLNVVKIEVPIYHYSYTRNPKLMKAKSITFDSFYSSKIRKDENIPFDYNQIDKIVNFNGEHPIYMKEIIQNKDWEFIYDPSKSNMKFKDKILNWFADKTGIHLFEYKNYKLIR